MELGRVGIMGHFLAEGAGRVGSEKVTRVQRWAVFEIQVFEIRTLSTKVL